MGVGQVDVFPGGHEALAFAAQLSPVTVSNIVWFLDKSMPEMVSIPPAL